MTGRRKRKKKRLFALSLREDGANGGLAERIGSILSTVAAREQSCKTHIDKTDNNKAYHLFIFFSENIENNSQLFAVLLFFL